MTATCAVTAMLPRSTSTGSTKRTTSIPCAWNVAECILFVLTVIRFRSLLLQSLWRVQCRSVDMCNTKPVADRTHDRSVARALESSRNDSETERSTLPRPAERASRDFDSAPLSPPPKRLLQRSSGSNSHAARADSGGEGSATSSPPQRMFERIVQPQLRQVPPITDTRQLSMIGYSV
jgi:hypothetical protein